jgi:hypothetical protein
MHGGKSLAGPASPSFKDGRYSRYLPKDLRKLHREVAEDPEWIGLREEINILRTRELELLQRLEKYPPVPWKLLTEAFEELDRAQDQREVDRLYDELGRLIAEGRDSALSHSRIWRELRQIFQERGRLAALEAKRLNDLRTTFTPEQGVSFIVCVMETAKQVINDRQLFRQLVDKLMLLMPPEGRRKEVVVEPVERE